MSAPILNLAIPQLPSGDLQRTADFFRDRLGFTESKLFPDHGFLNTLALALAARLVRVDGKPVLYEDFLDWPLADVMRAVAEVNRTLGNVLSPAAMA